MLVHDTITDEIAALVQDIEDMRQAIPLAEDRIAFLATKQRNLMDAFMEWVDAQQADDMTTWSPGEMVEAMMESVTVLPDEVLEVQQIATLWLVAQDLSG